MADLRLEEVPDGFKFKATASGYTAPTEEKDPEDPSTTSFAYDEMYPKWHKMNTLLGGTDAMRAQGELYLPRHADEEYKRYKERLKTTTLNNLTELTLESWVGRPFSKPIKISEDMPEEFLSYLENIDLQGNNLSVFARNVFRDGIAKGFTHILVEYPRKTDPENRPRTLEDDRKENLRPYLVHILPENLIAAYSEIINGQEVLTHIRVKETVLQRVGFTETFVERIRVIEPGIVMIYEKRRVKGKKDQWVIVDEYSFDLGFIPLVTFYSSREGFMMSKPPLSDLADLNITHWQSSSDQRAILTVARFPMLALSGSGTSTDDGGLDLTIGPNNWLYCPDPSGRFYYVEHTGASIGAGRQDLKDLEEAMSNYGAEFLKQRPGRETASARILDTVESSSSLQDMVLRFSDSLNQCLVFMGEWVKAPIVGYVELNADFGVEGASDADIAALNIARDRRDISRISFLEELKRRGTLDEDFDTEADFNELEKEAMQFSGDPQDELQPEDI